MSDKNVSSSSSGIGFIGLLTIVFITLKLTNFIEWSWWLVLLPMYAPVLIFLAIMIVYFIYLLIKDQMKC